MKLEDVDVLVYAKKEYQTRDQQRKELAKRKHLGPINVTNSVSVNDSDIQAAVRELVLVMVEKKFEEAITRCMALGIKEFPK
jgi:hypothetical protein